MTEVEFQKLVKRLELVADRNPNAYKLRVFLLAILGYIYIFTMLLILLVANVGIIYAFVTGTHSVLLLKIGFGVIVINFIIIRSLWVRIPPPDGIVLSDATPLIQLLKDIRKQLKGPKIHTILLTEEFNAAIVQNPRLGILGWQKNYLIIGIPLLQALSVPQITAVLAHEYGHLSGAHGHFSAWIYRIRQTWYQVMSNLESNDSLGSIFFFAFFKWYIPFFSAYSFVLARLNEYEADNCAAKVAGSEIIAQALINLEVKARFLEERFWPRMFADANKKMEPTYEPYKILPQVFNTLIKPEEAEHWFKQALQEKTDIADTHPCLTDRLIALDEKAQLPKPLKTNAADHFLGKNLGSVVKKLNQKWKSQVMPNWRKRYQYVQNVRQQLINFAEKAKTNSLTLEEKWQRAVWIEEFYDGSKAFSFYQAVLKEEPNHPGANYAIGEILLEKDNEKGVTFLERAIEQEDRYIVSGCNQIYHFFQKREKETTAKRYLEKAQARAELEHQAELERYIEGDDSLISHDLTSEQLETLTKQLNRQKTIEKAYLARKDVEYLPEQPLYVFGIVRTFGIRFSSHNKEYADKLEKLLKIPGRFVVIVLNDEWEDLHNNLKTVDEALIYEI